MSQMTVGATSQTKKVSTDGLAIQSAILHYIPIYWCTLTIYMIICIIDNRDKPENLVLVLW